MRQTHDESMQNLAERLCWEVTRGDDTGVTRRLDRKQVVDGINRLDEEGVLADFIYLLQALGDSPVEGGSRRSHPLGDGSVVLKMSIVYTP